jgi:tetrahydromethanopterin S-methyltransferase subunit D
LALTDASKLVEMSVATANTIGIPTNATVAFAVGTQVNVLQTGAGQTTIQAAAGVTVNSTPGLKLRTQWSSATLIKRATDTWVAVGDLST